MTTTTAQKDFLSGWLEALGVELSPAMQAERDQVRLEVGVKQIRLSHLGYRCSVEYITERRPGTSDGAEMREALDRGVRRVLGIWREKAGGAWLGNGTEAGKGMEAKE